MRFWDSSAVVPLLVAQRVTPIADRLIDEVPDIVIWWGTPLECVAALARLRREGGLTLEEESRLQPVLDDLRGSCVEIQPSPAVHATARRLLRTHPLRTADALQLAAAIEWAGRPDGHVLVTFDQRLADAARIEGFLVLGAADE